MFIYKVSHSYSFIGMFSSPHSDNLKVPVRAEYQTRTLDGCMHQCENIHAISLTYQRCQPCLTFQTPNLSIKIKAYTLKPMTFKGKWDCIPRVNTYKSNKIQQKYVHSIAHQKIKGWVESNTLLIKHFYTLRGANGYS